MVLRLLIISMFLSTTGFAKFRCYPDGKIRTIQAKKRAIINSAYCTEHPIYKIISFNCIKDNTCMALQKYRSNIEIKLYNSQVGGRDYHQCYLRGGTPELIEYSSNLSWIETGICRFEDSSFISVFNIIPVDDRKLP
jgi:hypothetical protein